MIWDEIQDLHLQVARELGAERNLMVRLAEPKDLKDYAFDVSLMGLIRGGAFRRQPRLRRISLAYYKPDDPEQLYCLAFNWVDLDHMDQIDANSYKHEIAATIRNTLEHKENPK
jgi:hypothetical protein